MIPSLPSRAFARRVHLPLLLLLLGALLVHGSCDNATNYTQGGVVVRATDFAGRLDGAIARASSEHLGTEARMSLEKASGVFLVDNPAKVSGLPDAVEVKPLIEDPAIRELLLGTDEHAVADKMVEAGVKGVVVHWRLKSAVDRGKRVASRLLHHDELERFQLLRITDELFIYRVLEAPIVFPPQLAAACAMSLRAILGTGRGIDLSKVPAPSEGQWELMASVRGQGRELGIGLARHKDLNSALVELARDIERTHRRYHEWYGFPPVREHISDLTIEIHRITERAHVEPRSEQDLEDLWEMGIDGVVIRELLRRSGPPEPGPSAGLDTDSAHTAVQGKPEVVAQHAPGGESLQDPDRSAVQGEGEGHRGVPSLCGIAQAEATSSCWVGRCPGVSDVLALTEVPAGQALPDCPGKNPRQELREDLRARCGHSTRAAPAFRSVQDEVEVQELQEGARDRRFGQPEGLGQTLTRDRVPDD